MKTNVALCLLLTVVVQTVVPPSLLLSFVAHAAAAETNQHSSPLLARLGQSMTLLPDGRWLLIGGEGPTGPQARASLWDPHSETMTLLEPLLRTRTGHSATALPDGNVLIFGGIGSDERIVEDAEIFSPTQQTFTLLPTPGLTPRAYHTATVLTDGSVFIAGGISTTGEVLNTAEVWSPQPQGVNSVQHPMTTARRNHTAVLLATGEVLLWGGQNTTGSGINSGEWFDPVTQNWTPLHTTRTTVTSEGVGPQIVASVPTDGATDAPLDSLIALRFSVPMQVETVTAHTLRLQENGAVQETTVVAAEGGMLAFVLPQPGLQPNTAYTLSVQGPLDEAGHVLPFTTLHFTTASQNSIPLHTAQGAADTSQKQSATTHTASPDKSERDSEDWIPYAHNRQGDWNAHRADPPEKSLPSLQADPGVTALAGQVFSLGSRPLAGVILRIGGHYAQTDDNGQFLLTDLPTGKQVLVIDGRNLGPGNQSYGLFATQVEITAGQTNVLPFTSWLPRLDKGHAVQIPSPTTTEMVVTTPHIPGLEVHIPPGATLQDYDGNSVTEVSITPISLDRTPFPLPANVPVPIYFTVQPGSAELLDGAKARIVYPNYHHEVLGARFNFWRYEPDGDGWEIYGQGSVSDDGQQVIPDPGVGIYEFMGAMVAPSGLAPIDGPPPCDAKLECCDANNEGNPINLFTGLKVETVTDLTLSDVIPLTLTRTYRPRDTISRAFGLGASHSYDWFFVGSTNPYTYIDLILPDGGRIHFDRISPGTDNVSAVYEHTATGTRFYKARITWNSAYGWDLTLKDGTLYAFKDGFNATRPGQGGLIKIVDRNGNIVTITRDSQGNVTQAASGTSPNGRWISFTYDTSNRITQARDSIGRTVNYTYDTGGRLWKVTDAGGGVTEYTYDASNRVLTKKDPRGNIVYTLQYDSTGKVTRETLADGAVYQFSYTLDGNGKVTQVDVTNPRNIGRRVTFNSSGYILTDTRALGLPEQQVTTYIRQTGTNFITSVTDALNRRTDYTYDTMGNRTNITHLAGTSNAMTTTYTYEPTFNRVASATDHLNHTTTIAYDSKGNQISVTNPLNQQYLITYNSAGQPLSVTNPLNNTTQLTYSFGDLATSTDPLGNTTTGFTDSVGRQVSLTTPPGLRTHWKYDALDRMMQTTDPINGVTTQAYDANGNMLSLTDARSGVTQYTYNTRNRIATRQDPLLRQESFQYDGLTNVTQMTDRKGQITTTTYDGLNRRTQVTYADQSTITYTYDAGNRLTQLVDSLSGTITRTYDGMNNLLSETTPQGAVTYTYDHANRRSSMTIAGQPTVNYIYDDANRLTQIAQGSATTTLVYDTAGQRTNVSLPNGTTETYSYDAARQLTGISYDQGTYPFTTLHLGELTYNYDKAGRRIATGGSYARTGLPQALSTATYDAANEQLTLGNKSATYDANGNLATLTDPSGTTTYTWNARNQLVSLSGPGLTASFQYDGLGRRKQKTINGTTTAFLYDGLNVVQELNGSTPVANLLTGLSIDEVFTRTDAAGTRAFFTDGLGSTLALMNGATASTQYTYEPFGKMTFIGATSTNAFQYTRRENDGTGLYYYRARYYQPALQRFVSEDPIGFQSEDPNLYEYVGNSPQNFTDPLGLLRIGWVPLPRLGCAWCKNGGPGLLCAIIGVTVMVVSETDPRGFIICCQILGFELCNRNCP